MKTHDVGPVAEELAVESETSRAEVREALWYCFKVFIVARIGLAILALVGVALLSGLPAVGVPGWAAPAHHGGWHNLFTAWERFDGLWFLRIADGGYVNGDGSAAFFPLYPLAIRALSWIIGGHPFAAALIISNAAFFGALFLMHQLTAEEFDAATARRATLYLAVFPTAFFFFAPYSESLFLLFALTSMFAARRGRWPVAGVAGALGAATRNVGVVLAAALAIEAIRQWRREGRTLVAPLAWSAFTGVGLLSYLLYWQYLAGDWLVPLTKQQNWMRQASFPPNTLVKATKEAFRFIGVYPGGYHLLDWLIVVPMLVAAIWVARRVAASYAIYTWGLLLIPMTLIFEPRPLLSFPRFLLPAFPLFWALARFAERYKAHDAIVAISATLLGVMTLLFVSWYYVF